MYDFGGCLSVDKVVIGGYDREYLFFANESRVVRMGGPMGVRECRFEGGGRSVAVLKGSVVVGLYFVKVL